jgi:hypothetical protein
MYSQEIFSQMPLLIIVIIILLAIWSAIWKVIALWKAARNGHKVWFAVFFLVNTAGILELLYIYIFSKKSPSIENK